MTMAYPMMTVQRMRVAGFACAAMALLLAGCVNTRTTTTGLVSATSDEGAGPTITAQSDATNAQKRAQLRMELAAGYLESGQNAVALDEVKRALAADPSYPDAYALRGLIYMRMEDAANAEDSFRRAIALNPRDANTRHNYGWLLCQQNRYRDAAQQFTDALSTPGYTERAKTLMTQGVCEIRAGQKPEAERTLQQAYDVDGNNPVVAYNLADLLSQRGEFTRAQFYIRRVNNGPLASAETLWLGIKIERKLNNREALAQLGGQLQRRFPQSREATAYERGNFDD